MKKNLLSSFTALLALFSILLYFQACKTSAPVEPEIPAQYGTLIVNADIDSAKIFIDSINTGKFAPDTFRLISGLHTVELYRTGFTAQKQQIDVKANTVKTANFMMSAQPDSGYIDITSNLASGYIVKVDGAAASGTVIKLRTGQHTIIFEKSGYRPDTHSVFVQKEVHHPLLAVLTKKMVIIEDFTNASCQFCVPMNEIIESLKKYSFSEAQMAVVQFHTNFPWSSDPMYLEAPSLLAYRYNYYSVYSAPRLVIDGDSIISARDSMLIKGAVNQSLNESAPFAVNARLNVAGSTANINVDIFCRDTVNIDFSNLVVHTLLIESLIQYETAPGAYGEKEYYNVLRNMPSGTSGRALGSMGSHTKQSFSVSSDIKSTWNSSGMRVVVFIQDKITKKVYQGCWND